MSDLDSPEMARARDSALWIDVRVSLAFCRAALRGLSQATPEVRAAVVKGLRDEAAIVRMENAAGAQAVIEMIDETRRLLEAV